MGQNYDFRELLMDSSWKEKLTPEIEKDYMKNLLSFLEEQRSLGKIIYPKKEDVFAAFNEAPYKDLKVVIIGQDPYHGPNQAHGLCFSVKEGIKPPPSLVNIYKELNQDLNIPTPNHGCLTKWAKQGVLLLNATLTVEEKKPKSHFGKGWEAFTDHIVDLLAKKEDPIVFMLWGRSAIDKCKNISFQNTKHLVLTAPHPSPFSAYTGFFGCSHFSKANTFLKKVGKEPIDWAL